MKRKPITIENCECGKKGIGRVKKKFYCVECYLSALARFKSIEKKK